MEKQNAIFFFMACALAFFSQVACSEAPEYTPVTMSQSSILGSRLSYLDEQHSKQALCDDYQLFLRLRTYMHHDAEQSLASQKCPENFRDFALKIKGAIAGLNDLHTAALFGNGLDATNYPVISGCDGDDELCSDVLGAPLFPIRTNVETHFYASVFGRSTQLFPLEVQSINGQAPLSFKNAMQKELLYSHTGSSWSQNLMDFILKRPALSDRERPDLLIEARSLRQQKRIRIRTSFEAVQKVFPNAAAVGSLHTIAVGREYGCVEAFSQSTFDIGACQRVDGKIIIWMAGWPQAEEFEAWQDALAAWLAPLKAATVYLDLRSNGGGSPVSPVTFLCRFGDDNSVRAIAKMKLSIRSFPRQWVIDGRSIATEDLDILDNLELKRINVDFEVRSNANEEPRFHEMGIFERSMLTEEGCKSLRVKDLAKTKWKVLTDGSEFSAAEDFLFLAKQSPEKFQIHGRPSVGGSGNPVWISLPHTNTGVRLSIARSLFGGQPVIEKKGVVPDFFIQSQETSEEIEARMLRFVSVGMLAKNDFIPKAFLDAFYK